MGTVCFFKLLRTSKISPHRFSRTIEFLFLGIVDSDSRSMLISKQHLFLMKLKKNQA